MNSLRILPTIILLFTILGASHAQGFQGVATYKTDRKVNIKLDSTTVSSDMQKDLMARMRKQFQKEFTLTFNQYESTWKQEAALSTPSAPTGNIVVNIVGGGGGSDVLYKNTKESRFAEKADMFGKIFLIQDSLSKPDWKLTNETKGIGNYTCYKATWTQKSKKITYVNGEKEESDEDEIRTITAWYTPEIPVNNGPDDYWGLPGLILEVNEDGDRLMLCSKIVLNPKEAVTITPPKKGKKVSKAEYEKITEKKAEEMMKRFQNNRSDGGDGIQIKIGG
ncbi:GLPGLI family protein [Spongiivirga citrea]|uniref:GLPGLI family protein n=1 Tax=Spongiivirga citrea TaxID=1481457 RepID=A0A6M0CLR6_9FLAO|nr:GLPGLI family protein [Spongiivirga citrea]NER18831.1 GLPGLI family protein [Spongiivirga citrea]